MTIWLAKMALRQPSVSALNSLHSAMLQHHYPALHRFITEEGGRIEVGVNQYEQAFAVAHDLSGTVFRGRSEYESLDAALVDLDLGIQAWFEKLGI